jgi:uncharacterized membrane protein (DUF2068 family)
MVRKRRHGGGSRAGRHANGIRLVALFEAAKGGVVLLAGLGLLELIHRNAQKIGEEIVRHLHINPARHYPKIFSDALTGSSDGRLRALAIAALLYALVRFAEAYGLWRRREWAIWFGILSGGIYLPLEAYELAVRMSAIKVGILLVNLFVVGWLVRVRGLGKAGR